MAEKNSVAPGLYVVATPIGNMMDISARALEVLRGVDLIAAEDTRHSAHLMQHFGISTRVVSFHDYSSAKRLEELVTRLQDRQSIALISDAGTPAISDPGYELVRLARLKGVDVIPVPGASALLAALSVAGLPSDSFLFEGFLPSKSMARQSLLASLAREPRSMVFFESTHRIVACLEDIASEIGGQRELYIGRELTKKFETSQLDTVANCLDWIRSDANQQKGEFVLVLAGYPKSDRQDANLEDGLRVLELLLEELPVKKAARLAARISGAPKNKLYEAALKLK